MNLKKKYQDSVTYFVAIFILKRDSFFCFPGTLIHQKVFGFRTNDLSPGEVMYGRPEIKWQSSETKNVLEKAKFKSGGDSPCLHTYGDLYSIRFTRAFRVYIWVVPYRMSGSENENL